ncbi:hypothetical protein D3C79_874970 [compost metagenome]
MSTAAAIAARASNGTGRKDSQAVTEIDASSPLQVRMPANSEMTTAVAAWNQPAKAKETPRLCSRLLLNVTKQADRAAHTTRNPTRYDAATTL